MIIVSPEDGLRVKNIFFSPSVYTKVVPFKLNTTEVTGSSLKRGLMLTLFVTLIVGTGVFAERSGWWSGYKSKHVSQQINE